MLHENVSSPVNGINEQHPLSDEQLNQMLRESSPLIHPALNRLQARLLASADTEAVITSYDRMHHRHSRS
ncbi:MAG: hypothetical protein QOH70_4045 [Blastocatellia bacterium]|jgi:hypothetical protein|nr:hypothetical protein [Blastocatellia bacterium]